MRETNKQTAGENIEGSELDLSVDLAPRNLQHLRLNNPVIIASGTFGYDGYGRGITDDMDLSALGAVIPKTVTRQPREGNPEPRWYPESFREAWEAGDQLFLNSIGLTNPGIDAALSELAPVWDAWPATILLSFSADSVDEFAEMTAMTQGVAGFNGIELNLSCPNVDAGSLFSVPDILPIATAAAAAGADALTLCNTIPAMRIDTVTGRPHLGNVTGGLSGMGLRPISLALVYQTAQAVDIPIIGVGGIFDADHAMEYILAGASAVQIGSANLVNLNAPWRILGELKKRLAECGVSDLAGLRGAAWPAPIA
jgi:dihydroorotate dehydrogenase (NAD+) catalytic subunit